MGRLWEGGAKRVITQCLSFLFLRLMANPFLLMHPTYSPYSFAVYYTKLGLTDPVGPAASAACYSDNFHQRVTSH